ncbi:hypothetical protein VNO80_01445 [Phaseolus coccineus]|uniref:Uncharacterized protein n=1 Tax=Phaseolus coccineus TaxID=3886 RepID=A0AAN9RSV0_PHACN
MFKVLFSVFDVVGKRVIDVSDNNSRSGSLGSASSASLEDNVGSNDENVEIDEDVPNLDAEERAERREENWSLRKGIMATINKGKNYFRNILVKTDPQPEKIREVENEHREEAEVVTSLRQEIFYKGKFVPVEEILEEDEAEDNHARGGNDNKEDEAMEIV